MSEQTAEPGCYLDGARGHYITRDMIELAEGFGYILDPFAAYALSVYERWGEDWSDPSPMEMALQDLSEEVLDWLNGGPNTGRDRAIRGQNSPPVIPEDHYWGFNDGDFGLYPDDDED